MFLSKYLVRRSAAKTEAKQGRILLVDDDREFLGELGEVLGQAGYEVSGIESGSAIVQVVREVAPDAIVIDLNMKPVSGFEAAGVLRNAPETSHIPVIAISGHYTLKEHEFLGGICGIRAFLRKPADPAEVVACLENVLKGTPRNRKRCGLLPI